MSDLADQADGFTYAEIATVLKRMKLAITLESTGHCLYCGEIGTKPNRFCDVHCRDDYDVEQAALRRSGQSR